MTSVSPAPLRLGILGCANIARQFVRDVAASPLVRVEAVASRDAAKARDFAAQLDVPRTHAGYEALLADDRIDAIYVPLPNSLHAQWAIACARHGKHVLCEKPLAMNLAEASEMHRVARARGVVLLEAYPWWFQPQTGADARAAAWRRRHRFGARGASQLRIHARLIRKARTSALVADLGGGALMDAGCYCLSLIRLVMGRAPQSVQAISRREDRRASTSRPARRCSSTTRAVAQLHCAMDIALSRHAVVVGSDGFITTEFLNHTADAGTAHPWEAISRASCASRRGSGNGPVESLSRADRRRLPLCRRSIRRGHRPARLRGGRTCGRGESGHRRDPRCDRARARRMGTLVSVAAPGR